MSTSGSVLPIDGATKLPAAAGGKARGLAEIAGAGLAVPLAWAVLPGTANGELKALTEALAAKGIVRVAVRSSAADEDGGQQSFAGIHGTELGVALEKLSEAIPQVAASPQSARASAYRRQHGLPEATGPCAVVVQEMVDAEWAGVAFGKGDGVLIEAVEGLGEVAVNGDATPEQLELLREGMTFRVTRRWPRMQPFAVRASAVGTERSPLDGNRPTLPEAVALAVAAGVAALERVQGRPLDVEWAARSGKVAFLQARPQTRPLEAGLPPGEVWTRANIADTFPEIVSALARGASARALDRSMHEANELLGVPFPAELRLSDVVAGRLVFNEKALCGAGDAVGVSRSWLRVLAGGAGEGTNAYVRPDLWKMIRRVDVLVRMVRLTSGAEHAAERHIRELRARYERRWAARDAERSDVELLGDVADHWGDETHRSLMLIVRVAGRLQQVVTAGAMALKAHPAPAALLARLVDPEQISVSTQQLEEQVEIGREMWRWAGARPFLQEIGPRHASASWWAKALPPPLWARVERWLAEFGHRCPNESDPAQPRGVDDLWFLAAALRPFVFEREEPESREARLERRRADSSAAWEEASSRFGAIARWRLRGPARELGRLMRVREELRSAVMLQLRVQRRDCLELGRRLVVRGLLDSADEVFHLTIDELGRTLRAPAFDARAAVARERARVAAWRRIEVPNRFTSEEVPGFGRIGATSAGGESLLGGTAVSPGVVEGRACVLRSPDDESKMALGGILVTHATDPGWAPLFARAAGVVVELGGVMSHSATVAREYGLPCVSNVDGAIAKLRDGDLLRVDGMNGTVEIVERAQPG